MKTLIAMLIIISFIQTTILPMDLVLIILICRSYIRSDKSNLYWAFGFGLLNGHLNLNLLGINSLIYLILVGITESLSRSRLAGNPFLIIPLTLILVSINHITLSILTNASIQFFPKVVVEAALSLPILYLIKMWEERFIVRKEIKLRF